MIEAAFVSGPVGRVLYETSGVLYSFGVGSQPVPASPSDLQEIFRPGFEYEVFSNKSIDELRVVLDDRVHKSDALFLFVSLLNPDLSFSCRLAVAQTLEGMLSDDSSRDFLVRRVLSIPLPLEPRSLRHELSRPIHSFEAIKTLLDDLFASQPILDELWGAWSGVLDEHKIDDSSRSQITSYIVDSGLFVDLLRAIQSNDLHALNSVAVAHTLKPGLSAVLRTSQSVLTAFRSQIQSRFFAQARARQKNLKFAKSSVKREPVQKSAPDFSSDFVFELGDGQLPRKTIGALEAKNRVDKQISAIREVLFAGKNALAEKYLQELMEFQLGQGDREHAVMSLCALTAISLEANQLEMADRLSDFAVRLSSDDPVVYTTRAEVFKQRGHFHSALRAYEEAIQRFPTERYPRAGIADVLKEMERFDESIKLYRETQKLFPEDPVAFNGEVGATRSKGDLRGALKVAVVNAKRFPYDGVTRASVAGCLGALGKYEEAIRHYEVALSLQAPSMRMLLGYIHALKASGKLRQAIQYTDTLISRLPSHPSLLNIKATLLRSAGRLDEALKVLEGLIERFPTYTPARFSAAIIRILQDGTDAARSVLPEDRLESELDWFGYRALALSYARTGDFNEAATRLILGIEKCPWHRERAKLRTALGFVELHRSDARKSVQLLQQDLERLEDRDRQVRLVLLGHAHAALGSKEVARVILGTLVSTKDSELAGLGAALNARYGIGAIIAATTPQRSDQFIISTELSVSMAV